MISIHYSFVPIANDPWWISTYDNHGGRRLRPTHYLFGMPWNANQSLIIIILVYSNQSIQ